MRRAGSGTATGLVTQDPRHAEVPGSCENARDEGGATCPLRRHFPFFIDTFFSIADSTRNPIRVLVTIRNG
jgi:hypothetical protein